MTITLCFIAAAAILTLYRLGRGLCIVAGEYDASMDAGEQA